MIKTTSTFSAVRKQSSKGGEIRLNFGVSSYLFIPLMANKSLRQSQVTMKSTMYTTSLHLRKSFVSFLHAAIGFPMKAMLLTSIKNDNSTTFPGLVYAEHILP